MDINYFFFAHDWFEEETVIINAKRYRRVIEQFYDDFNATITPSQICRTWFMQDGPQLIPRKAPLHIYTNYLKLESLFLKTLLCMGRTQS